MESVWNESTLASYAAGIIDGEGSISLQRMPISLQVQFGQSLKGKCLVDFMVKHFQAHAGSAYFVKNKPGRQRMIPCYWRGTKALRFLKIIRPFLIFKIEQADLAIRFQERILESGRSRAKWGEGKKQWARTQYQLMRFLNRKGHEANQLYACPETKAPDTTLFDALP